MVEGKRVTLRPPLGLNLLDSGRTNSKSDWITFKFKCIQFWCRTSGFTSPEHQQTLYLDGTSSIISLFGPSLILNQSYQCKTVPVLEVWTFFDFKVDLDAEIEHNWGSAAHVDCWLYGLCWTIKLRCNVANMLNWRRIHQNPDQFYKVV